jgi:release factor glutamine methyltransferase
MTFAEAEKLFCEQLSGLYEPGESAALFAIAVSHFFNIGKAKLLAIKNEKPDREQVAILKKVLRQLRAGKPVQYITCAAEFCGMVFRVGPEVLIPRPETEELVQMVVHHLLRLNTRSPFPAKVLDIGTGSGCIAVSVKKKAWPAEVWALDVSNDALAVAKENAANLGADVCFVPGDIREGMPVKDESGRMVKFDVIVSNPPYIPLKEAGGMHTNVVDHEPHLALFVDDGDPLVFYRKVAEFAWQYLRKEGCLFFEIHERIGTDVVTLLAEQGFAGITIRKDLNGKDRMIAAFRQVERR